MSSPARVIMPVPEFLKVSSNLKVSVFPETVAGPSASGGAVAIGPGGVETDLHRAP